MSILSQVTTGVSRAGLRIVLAAQEKMGKTTLASQAPAPLLVPCEVGFAGVQCPKTPMIQTWEELLQLIGEIQQMIQARQFPFKTLCFDSGTAMERMLHDYVIRLDPAYRPGMRKSITMEAAHGGYGKAYNLAKDHFNGILQQFDQLAVYAGINIIMTAHVFASRVVDPTSGEYDSWDLQLHSPKNQKTYGVRELVTQWADVIGFIYEPVFVSKADGGNMSRAVSQNKGRVLGLSRTPNYVAGNRFGVVGEIPLPAPTAGPGWNHLADALFKQAQIDVFTR